MLLTISALLFAALISIPGAAAHGYVSAITVNGQQYV
jgi:hypothetical protein